MKISFWASRTLLVISRLAFSCSLMPTALAMMTAAYPLTAPTTLVAPDKELLDAPNWEGVDAITAVGS